MGGNATAVLALPGAAVGFGAGFEAFFIALPVLGVSYVFLLFFGIVLFIYIAVNILRGKN
jgi:hypothetical protein